MLVNHIHITLYDCTFIVTYIKVTEENVEPVFITTKHKHDKKQI